MHELGPRNGDQKTLVRSDIRTEKAVTCMQTVNLCIQLVRCMYSCLEESSRLV